MSTRPSLISGALAFAVLVSWGCGDDSSGGADGGGGVSGEGGVAASGGGGGSFEEGPEDCPDLWTEQCGCTQTFEDYGCLCTCNRAEQIILEYTPEFPDSGVCADLDGTTCGTDGEFMLEGCEDYVSPTYCGP